jgi:hypothetical protein
MCGTTGALVADRRDRLQCVASGCPPQDIGRELAALAATETQRQEVLRK